jgi:hypothetical protein
VRAVGINKLTDVLTLRSRFLDDGAIVSHQMVHEELVKVLLERLLGYLRD